MKRILVVEDNEKNLYLMSYILKSAGYEVLEAGSGEEGAELAKSEKPDLVIMDIRLPGIGGLKAAKRIRQSEAGRKTPIVAVTAYAMAGDRGRILKGGCTSYIEKPIDPETFLSEIEKHLASGG